MDTLLASWDFTPRGDGKSPWSFSSKNHRIKVTRWHNLSQMLQLLRNYLFCLWFLLEWGHFHWGMRVSLTPQKKNTLNPSQYHYLYSLKKKSPIGSAATQNLSFRRTDRWTDRHRSTLYYIHMYINTFQTKENRYFCNRKVYNYHMNIK